MDEKNLKNELKLIVTNLEYFTSNIESTLEEIDWHAKRDIIRTLVKRIEIDCEDVNVVFRVKELPDSNGRQSGGSQESLQYCCRSNKPFTGKFILTLRIRYVDAERISTSTFRTLCR